MRKIKKKLPEYLNQIITNNPRIASGRKNYENQHKRVLKNIELTKKYFKELKNL